jgi:hypothetical protein
VPMALEKRKQSAFRRIGTWIKTVTPFVLDPIKSFLNFKEEDGFKTKGKKTVNLVARRIVYFIADYYLMAVSASIVATMKYLGHSFLWTFAALWVFDLVVAGIFIAVFETTGEDLSLGVDFRRAVDMVHKKSRIAGYTAMLVVVGQALFWTGPEKIVTFFRKEIGTIFRIILVLLFLTFVQSFIWTFLYGVGYDLIVKWF